MVLMVKQIEDEASGMLRDQRPRIGRIADLAVKRYVRDDNSLHFNVFRHYSFFVILNYWTQLLVFGYLFR